MAVGQKTTEVTAVNGPLALASSLIGNANDGTARIPIATIPELLRELLTIASNETILLDEGLHFQRHLNIENGDGPVALNLNDSDVYLIDQVDGDGINKNRGGLFLSFTVASAANPVSFNAQESGNLRASGNPFQNALTADTVYVGANPAAAAEASGFLFKRSGLWVAHCPHGWRTTETGDELSLSGSEIAKELSVEANQNRQISDADHQKPIWLTNASPGTLTFATELSEGMQTSIINRGSATATVDFTGHTQVGSVNSIDANEAATLIVGPITTGTNREIILKASS